MRIVCQDLEAGFAAAGGRKKVLQGITLETRPEEFLTILGPSGCGKTTLLRLITGALQPYAGRLERIRTSTEEGATPLLIRQEQALFPWLTALDNACFGLAMRGVAPAERKAQALPLFQRYGLEGSQNSYPHQLSAGMKQRIALIRAFLSHPPMLLLDEPFAALDPDTRLTLQQDLLELWETREHVGVIFVTHDVDEAILLSDRIVLLSPNPTTIRAQFRVRFSRPRDPGLLLQPEFIHLKRQILTLSGSVREEAYCA